MKKLITILLFSFCLFGCKLSDYKNNTKTYKVYTKNKTYNHCTLKYKINGSSGIYTNKGKLRLTNSAVCVEE